MKSLDHGQDKIKKLSDLLRKDTLEPAEHEADAIRKKAKQEAEAIVRNAEAKAEALHAAAQGKIAKERAVFENSMKQAFRQSIELLRQKVQDELFSKELYKAVLEGSSAPDLVAKMVNAIVGAIGRDGISTDLSAVVSKEVDADAVNRALLAAVTNRLREKAVVLGGFAGGIKVKLHDEQMTLDLSDKALEELLKSFLGKRFREFLFAEGA